MSNSITRFFFGSSLGFVCCAINCASGESDDDDCVLVCRAKTALVRVNVATVGWSRRVSESSFAGDAQVQGRHGESSTGLISLNRPKRAEAEKFVSPRRRTGTRGPSRTGIARYPESDRSARVKMGMTLWPHFSMFSRPPSSRSTSTMTKAICPPASSIASIA